MEIQIVGISKEKEIWRKRPSTTLLSCTGGGITLPRGGGEYYFAPFSKAAIKKGSGMFVDIAISGLVIFFVVPFCVPYFTVRRFILRAFLQATLAGYAERR